MASPDNDAFVRSFARGLAVIEAMGRSHLHTVATVTAATGLPRSVVRRILMTLCELGYATEAEQRGYRLTPKILRLGMSYLGSLPFWGHAQRLLEQLCQQIGESCALSVFDGDEVMYVLRIPSPKIMSVRLGIGSLLPAYATAPGRALLAYQDEAFVDAYRRRVAIRPLTARTLSAADLPAALARVREDGYAWVDGEFDLQICGFAVPVRDERQQVVAALSVNLLSGEMSRSRAARRLLPPVRAAAQQLSGLAPAFLGPAPANRPPVVVADC